MQVTIDRSKWDRGNGQGVFYNPRTGASCFLGHVLIALGVHQHELVDDQGHPYGSVSQLPVPLRRRLPLWLFRPPDPDTLYVGDLMSNEVRRMIDVNDSKRHSLQDRENLLAREIGQFGIDTTFIGDPSNIPDRVRLTDMCDVVPIVYGNPRPKESIHA